MFYLPYFTLFYDLYPIVHEQNSDRQETRKRTKLQPNDNSQSTLVTSSVSTTETDVLKVSAYAALPIVILTSCISSHDEEYLTKFSTSFKDITLTHAFKSPIGANPTSIDSGLMNIATNDNPPVTHLIVPVDANNIFPQRTMKYMQAIIGKSLLFSLALLTKH